jgi:hypothetical protein
MKKTIFLIIFLLLLVSALLILNPFSDINRDVELEDISLQESGFMKLKEKNPIISNIETNLFRDSIIDVTSKKDSIPPIDNPVYSSVSIADEYLNDTDKVFIYEATEGVFIYPQRILVWHEIVNEFIDDEWVSITYCPLTGSTICYSGNDGIYKNNDFGTSGRLLNSNLVMYDRASNSFISQILGTGLNGNMNGISLKTRPIHWAEWSKAKLNFPDAFVLTIETGYLRDYYTDPYGTYEENDENSYYLSGESMFKTMNEGDKTFNSKKIVVGIKHDDNIIALDPDIVLEKGVVNFSIGNENGVAFYDNQIDAVRVFYSQLNNEKLIFTYSDGKFIDQKNRTWNRLGTDGTNKLNSMTYFDVMWFAWYAFYPNTEVVK